MGWKRGETIMTSEPYAHVLSNKYRQQRCSFCFRREETVKKCTACSVLRYCGRDCQRQDWRVHKEECRCLQRVAPNTPTDSVMLMLRLVIKFKKGEHHRVMDKDPGLRTFQQLMSHCEEVKQDAERCDAFSKICFTLSKLAGTQMQLPDTAQLLDIFGKMVINTFTIADEEMQDVGSGIYLSPSSLDHRCIPNAVVTFQGKSLCVRAVVDISCGELMQVSEVVYLSYVDQLAPSWERQQQLQQQYYFVCQCPRCHDSSLDKVMTSGIKTDLSNQAAEVEEGDATVQAAIKSCQTVLNKADEIKKSSGSDGEILQLCRDCLAKVKDILSPFNVYMLRVLDHAFDAAVSSALWEEALGYGIQTLEPYRKLLPPNSPNLGLQLLRVGKLQLWLDRLRDAHHNISQAESIVAVTHGKESEPYSQVMGLLMQTVGTGDLGPQSAAIEMS